MPSSEQPDEPLGEMLDSEVVAQLHTLFVEDPDHFGHDQFSWDHASSALFEGYPGI